MFFKNNLICAEMRIKVVKTVRKAGDIFLAVIFFGPELQDKKMYIREMEMWLLGQQIYV